LSRLGLVTCFVSSALRCWGSDWAGQVSGVPRHLDIGRTGSVSLGHSTGCLVTLKGTLSCWGHTFTSDSSFFGVVRPPDQKENIRWAAVGVGGDHACAISDTETLYCWGNNKYGQSNVTRYHLRWKAVSCGGYHSCAVTKFGGFILLGWEVSTCFFSNTFCGNEMEACRLWFLPLLRS